MNVIEEFDHGAGKVWQTLNSFGPLTESVLLKTTKLDEKTFSAAVGWLARENKIRKSNIEYELGETNLTDIGANAGKVWKALEAWGEIDLSGIIKLAQITEHDAYAALGWLARENKITTKHATKLKEPVLKFTLK